MTVRTALLWGFRQVLRIYFRKVDVAGDVPREHVRGRLFAPNHVNGLVDPLLVLTTAECLVSPIGKAPLWKIPVLGMLLDAVGAVPVVRRRDDPTKGQGANDAIFEKVGGHLAGGGNVLIFPEGTSHNEPHLVKIRTGPARMLLRAYESGARDVTFQAVGLEFEARDSFRSRVLVLYGPVRRIEETLGDNGRTGSAGGDDAVRAVSSALEADLASIVVSAETWDERRLIARVAQLLVSLEPVEPEDEARGTSMLRRSELARTVRDAGRDLVRESPEALDPIRAKVSVYFDALERDGLVDNDLRAHDGRPIRAGRIGPLTMMLVAPFALVGTVLYAVPYRIPRSVASRARARGQEDDVVSTFKLAAGIVVFPSWAILLALLASLLLPSPFGWIATLLVIATPLPALWWLDAFEDGLLRPRKTPEALRVLRDEAMAAVEIARQKHLARAAVPGVSAQVAP